MSSAAVMCVAPPMSGGLAGACAAAFMYVAPPVSGGLAGALRRGHTYCAEWQFKVGAADNASEVGSAS